MKRIVGLFSLLCLVVCTIGCGDGKKKATTVPVKGSVTIDGRPLALGEIYFVLSGEAPTVFEIKDGAYSGNANVGANKVEIRAYKDGPPLTTDPEKKPTKVNYIPSNYNDHSTLKAEVAASGANEFNFPVTSR